jgi:hypothetical protein
MLVLNRMALSWSASVRLALQMALSCSHELQWKGRGISGVYLRFGWDTVAEISTPRCLRCFKN